MRKACRTLEVASATVICPLPRDRGVTSPCARYTAPAELAPPGVCRSVAAAQRLLEGAPQRGTGVGRAAHPPRQILRRRAGAIAADQALEDVRAHREVADHRKTGSHVGPQRDVRVRDREQLAGAGDWRAVIVPDGYALYAVRPDLAVDGASGEVAIR